MGWGARYDRFYAAIAGTGIALRPWHFQWLASRTVHQAILQRLPLLSGRVLDVGCGAKPFAPALIAATEHIGLEIAPAPHVDVVVKPGERWPFPDAGFDSVLCTQVLEHAEDPDLTLAECARVLRPGGLLLATVPFLFNGHDLPRDYGRWTGPGLARQLGAAFEPVETADLGGFGSTAATLTLNWLDMSATRTRAGRIARLLFLPAWLPACLVVNVLAFAVDALDRTGAFAGHILILARRRLPA